MTSSPPAEPSELDIFADFCERTLTAEDASPLALHPFQRRMLGDLFEGTRETLILIPKKNGKSTILAGLALFHLCSTPDAECVIAAASRDQAGIMLRQAQGFIRRSPALQERLKVKQREIGHRTLGGRIRILASDVDTVDGVIPTLALVDELHRHKTADLYAIFRDGLGPRNGKMVTISTAGDREDSPLGQLRQTAYALPMEVDGPYRYARLGSFAMHEWALAPDDNRDDIALVKLANPAPWQSEKKLRDAKASPSMQPWQWARFRCGVWMAGEEGAISVKEWHACAGGKGIPAGSNGVIIGIDLGWKWDTTAAVPIWMDDAGIIQVGQPRIIVPPRDGTTTLFEDIWQPLEEMHDLYGEVTFVLDPEAGGEQLAQRLDSELSGRVATHSQKVGPMALAAQRLSEAISAKRIAHPDDEDLNLHVLAASAKAVGEGWRFVKSRKQPRPIDGVIALAMAHSVLLSEPEPKQSNRLIAY